LHIESEDTQ
ncbi:hypothetical protein CISIN_1g0465301mg, partial [Citrus sinensis]